MATRHKIFVAYPYSFPQEDYRKPFVELEQSFAVKFVYADEEITSKHILDKITGMIREARFCLFDISMWNPNVTLELGIAIGHRQDYYLLFNPEVGRDQPPSDLGGHDRIQYTSYGKLADGLTKLLLQEFGVPKEGRDMAAELEALRERVPGIVSQEDGPEDRRHRRPTRRPHRDGIADRATPRRREPGDHRRRGRAHATGCAARRPAAEPARKLPST